MGLVASGFITVNPHYMAPEAVVKFNQASGAFNLLHGRRPEVRLGEGDLAVYMNTVDVRTKAAAGQQSYEDLPSVSVILDYISTPTYLLRNRYNFNHHDASAAATRNVSIDSALRLGSRQGIAQLLRNMLLYGVNAANGEGLLNAAGVFSTNLPPDSNGNTTVSTYDNGQMAFYIAGLIVANESRMYQLGMKKLHTVVVAPQRILGPMQQQNIVQLVQFQRPGAGSMSTTGVIQEIQEMAENTIEFAYDDTLQGQGAGGADMMIIGSPTVKNPEPASAIDTNEFARLMPSFAGTFTMYCDMAAPREIRSPLAGGAIDCLLEMRATPGWAVRPEGWTLLSLNP